MMIMKKKSVLLAALAAILALSFALVGCGGKGGGGDANPDAFYGDWTMTSLNTGDEADSISEEDMASFTSLGMTFVLTMNEDGTLVLDLAGDTESGTWEVTGKNAGTARFASDDFEIALAGDTLTFTDSSGGTMSFKRGGSSGTTSTTTTSTDDATTAAPTATTTSAAGFPIVVADDDICRIEVTGMDTDFADDPGFNITITNNTDRPIYFTSSYGTFSVDGMMIDGYVGETIQAGKYVNTFMWFDMDDLGGGTEKLVNVEGQFEVWDDETYDTLGTYSFAM